MNVQCGLWLSMTLHGLKCLLAIQCITSAVSAKDLSRLGVQAYQPEFSKFY